MCHLLEVGQVMINRFPSPPLARRATARNFIVLSFVALAVRPQVSLIHPLVLPDSESKKPMTTVYLRHEYATIDHEKFSIREVHPLP